VSANDFLDQEDMTDFTIFSKNIFDLLEVIAKRFQFVNFDHWDLLLNRNSIILKYMDNPNYFPQVDEYEKVNKNKIQLYLTIKIGKIDDFSSILTFERAKYLCGKSGRIYFNEQNLEFYKNLLRTEIIT
jgi:hypothetical protein